MTAGGLTGAGDAVTPADLVGAAVLSCPDVAAMSGGRWGEVATYLPGRRVSGVVITPGSTGTRIAVHVVARFGPTMAEVSRQVLAAVRSVVPGAVVDVFIDDLAEPKSTVAPRLRSRVR
ncbi:MAG: Asp23/Gls24 family envelope stress response protein [Geodermatophilaceae bacterium]|nr:Asp23/Gls24 family envelope stress response protein [Geodermatophilaceae bacterium]